MRRISPLISASLLALMLGGCATAAQLDKEGHDKCVAWGAAPKTKEYRACRISEEQNQIARQQGIGGAIGTGVTIAGSIFTFGGL